MGQQRSLQPLPCRPHSPTVPRVTHPTHPDPLGSRAQAFRTFGRRRWQLPRRRRRGGAKAAAAVSEGWRRFGARGDGPGMGSTVCGGAGAARATHEAAAAARDEAWRRLRPRVAAGRCTRQIAARGHVGRMLACIARMLSWRAMCSPRAVLVGE